MAFAIISVKLRATVEDILISPSPLHIYNPIVFNLSSTSPLSPLLPYLIFSLPSLLFGHLSRRRRLLYRHPYNPNPLFSPDSGSPISISFHLNPSPKYLLLSFLNIFINSILFLGTKSLFLVVLKEFLFLCCGNYISILGPNRTQILPIWPLLFVVFAFVDGFTLPKEILFIYLWWKSCCWRGFRWILRLDTLLVKRTVKMSHHSRRIVTPGPCRKRKERDEASNPSQPSSPVTTVSATKGTTSSKQADPVSSTRLLAGYMAHEFLTKGTLLGQEFIPARAEAVPVSGARRGKPGQGNGNGFEQSQSYAEVASLLKSDGASIVGIVNPTQLARWIQMWQQCKMVGLRGRQWLDEESGWLPFCMADRNQRYFRVSFHCSCF